MSRNRVTKCRIRTAPNLYGTNVKHALFVIAPVNEYQRMFRAH